MKESSELLNGRLAMIGFVAALGAYATTGQVIPGIFQPLTKVVQQQVATTTRSDSLSARSSLNWDAGNLTMERALGS